MVQLVHPMVSFLMSATVFAQSLTWRCVGACVILVCLVAPASGATISSVEGLLHAARSAGQAQSAEIFGRIPSDSARADHVGLDEADKTPAPGATDGGFSTRAIVVTAAITALVTAALTYALLRTDDLCIVRPEMEYFVPRGHTFLVPVGINPPPRGCVFGRPD